MRARTRSQCCSLPCGRRLAGVFLGPASFARQLLVRLALVLERALGTLPFALARRLRLTQCAHAADLLDLPFRIDPAFTGHVVPIGDRGTQESVRQSL